MARALTAFFISGFAGLLYQIVWQRLLGIFSGADVQSATIVIAAFMAGLGSGSLAGGHLADRVGRRTAVALFAIAELAVGAFGLFSGTLFYDVLYQRVGQFALGPASTAGIQFIALLWPTFFMGMSLPLLSRGVTASVERAAATVGWLYGINTVGAALGAVAATWCFLPQLGLAGSLKVAAVLNFTCAAIAVTLAAGARGSGRQARSDAPAASTISPAHDGAALPAGAWVMLFGLSGFIALSLEIVWFRLLGVMLKSTAFTFGTLLGIYLIGLGVGSTAGGAAAARVRAPARWFLLLQATAIAYAVLSLTLFAAGLERWAPLGHFAAYFRDYEALDIRAVVTEMQGVWAQRSTAALTGLTAQFLRLYVALPAILVLPPTLLAGFSFPLLQRVVQTELARLGRRVGAVLAANILGSTLGAFVTGWLLLDAAGTAGTLRLLAAASACFGLLAVHLRVAAAHHVPGAARRLPRALGYAAPVVIAGALAFFVPAERTLWGRLHGAPPARVIVGEDRSGLSVLRAERLDFRRVVVFVNGRGQSWIPYGEVHTVLGALPAFVHPHPRSAALIGLGSGDSLFAVAGRRELERLVSIEIIKPQLDTLESLRAQLGYPGLVAALEDPRVEHVFGDGRLYLRQGGRKYDIIEADALYPSTAYSGNLYSDAYFRLLRDHLNPGGIAVSWIPTERAGRTFLTVFPYVWHHPPFMLGSNEPIRIDRDAIRLRLADRRVQDYFTIAGVNISALLDPYLTDPGTAFDPAFDRSELLDINTDLYPKDEFDIPSLLPRQIAGRWAR